MGCYAVKEQVYMNPLGSECNFPSLCTSLEVLILDCVPILSTHYSNFTRDHICSFLSISE